MKKIITSLCLLLAISSVYAQTFVPDPNKVYNIIANSGGMTIGALGTQPSLAYSIDSKSQAFHFVPTGATDTYYLLNMDNMYLNKKSSGWDAGFATIYEATTNGTSSEWVITGADATGIRLKNNNNQYLSSDGTGSGSSLYCDKPVDHWAGSYKLQEATVYTTPATLYNENFNTSWTPNWGNDSWAGSPSTVAINTPINPTANSIWSGGIDLQTTGDATMRLDQWWNDHGHILHINSTDAAVIIPNINVAGYDNLQVSFDTKDENGSPVIDVQVGSGAWVSVTTVSTTYNWQWKNLVLDLKDETGSPIKNVSTISLRFSHSGSDLYLDNVKVLGRIHYKFTGGTSTDPTVSNNWVGGEIPPTSGPLEIVSGNLELNQNATYSNVIVDPTAKLTLNNTITLAASSLLLKSDATGTGTFVDANAAGGLTVSGTTTVQRYLNSANSSRNWYISSPVSTATSNVFGPAATPDVNSKCLYWYDETLGSNNWAAIIDNSTSLTAGKGYIAHIPTASYGTFTFTGGTLNTGSKSISLTNSSANTGFKGYNLVGNPYPSYLNWNLASGANAGVSTTMYYKSMSGSTYFVDTYNATGSMSVSASGNTITGYIPPMQAFWVYAPTAGTLSLTNAMRSHLDVAGNLFKAPASKSNSQSVLRLKISNGTNGDETLIYADSNATNGYDSYDSPKMSNNSVSIPEIYTTVNGHKLVIDGLNSISADTELPLGFTTGQSNEFSIKATEFSNFDANTRVYLKDKLLGTETDLTDGTAYSFSSDVASTTDRFSVVFKSAGIATSLNNASGDQVALIFKNANNQITVNCKGDISDNAFISVYNALGQQLETKQITSATTVIGKTFTSGVYVVTVNNGGKNTTKKVILN
jgi:hypothetical protein